MSQGRNSVTSALQQSPAEGGALRAELEDNPPEAELLMEALAQGYAKVYLLHAAQKYLDEWVRRRPDSVRARLRRGWVEERLDHLDGAEEDYRQLLSAHP